MITHVVEGLKYGCLVLKYGYSDLQNLVNIETKERSQCLKQDLLEQADAVKAHIKRGVEGQLFRGCVEVLDWLRGTDYFPPASDLQGAVIFLETSEDAPPPSFPTEFVRCLAAMDFLEGLGFNMKICG